MLERPVVKTKHRAAQLASIQAALTGQVAATSGSATTQRMIIQAAAVIAAVGREIAREVGHGMRIRL